MLYLILFIVSDIAYSGDCPNTVFNFTSIPSTNTVPFKRLYHTMDYNSKTNQFIIFGGKRDLTLSYNDVWIFDLATTSYTLCYPTSNYLPEAERWFAGGFVDESTNIFYIFGGITNLGPQNDIWSFEIETYNWRRLSPTGKVPSSRYRFGYTKFYWNNVFYFAVFGGSLITGESNELFFYSVQNNTWVLKNNTKNTPILHLNGPGLEFYKDSLYVAVGNATTTDIQNFSGLYKYSIPLSTWTILNITNAYTPRYFSQTTIINSTLFLLYGWSDNLQDDVNDISFIDLNTLSQWNILNTTNCGPRDSFTALSKNSEIYLFGGYLGSTGDTLNDLIVLSYPNWTCSTINTNYEVPPARQYHSLSAINGEIYIFGGLGQNGNLADMWKLSSSQEWVSITPTGDIPSPRNGHAFSSDGDIIAVWGGESNDGYMNDLYIFNAFGQTWKRLDPSGILPSSKVQACLVLNLPVIYIFGGNSNAGLTNELWVYYTANNSYTLIEAEGAPDFRYQAFCEILDDVLWVMLGTGQSDVPLKDIYCFDLRTWTWSQVSDNVVSSSLGIVKHFDQFILSLAGEQYTTDPKKSVLIINATTGESRCIGYIPIYYYAGAFTVIKTTLYLHAGGSLLGSNLRLSVASIGFYSFDLKEIPEFSQICSPGSYYDAVSDACIECVAGFYSDGYFNENCEACPKGTYNPNSGASSASQCYPCAYGSYSNATNATFCLQCPVGKVCPIGSTIFINDVIDDTTVSKQPKDYSPDAELISQNETIIYAVIAATGFVSLVLIFMNAKVKHLVKEIDFFYDQHCYELQVPIVLIKNFKGGLFFFLFSLAAIFIIAISVLAFVDNNIIEEKTLRPMAVLDQMVSEISADIYIEIELMNYGASCQTTSDINLQLKSSYIDSSQFSYIVFNLSNSCFLDAFCSNCKISVGDSIFLSAYQEKSYCSGFSVNVTSQSSIPGSLSMMKTAIYSDNDKVFRGYSQTVFSFTMTPSYFQSFISELEDNTGYHVSVDVNPTAGTEIDISEISFASGLLLQVDLTKNNDGLYTKRSYKQQVITFLSTLLGSVFGIMGAFNGVLRFVENSLMSIAKKLSNREDFRNMKKKRNKFEVIFGDDLDGNQDENDSIPSSRKLEPN